MTLKKFSDKRIGEVLIEEGLVERTALEKALKKQEKEGGRVGEILVQRGAVTEENLVFALSKQLNLPFIRLGNYQVNRNALKLIPREVAERFLFFPFEQEANEISVAMVDPLDEAAREAIEKRVPFRVQIFLAAVSEVRKAIETHYALAAAGRESS